MCTVRGNCWVGNIDARPLRRRRKLFRVSFNYARKCTNAIYYVKGQRIRRRILCKALSFLSFSLSRETVERLKGATGETIVTEVPLDNENETRNM